MTGPTRLELATSGVTGRRSNRLNYDPVAARSEASVGTLHLDRLQSRAATRPSAGHQSMAASNPPAAAAAIRTARKGRLDHRWSVTMLRSRRRARHPHRLGNGQTILGGFPGRPYRSARATIAIPGIEQPTDAAPDPSTALRRCRGHGPGARSGSPLAGRRQRARSGGASRPRPAYSAPTRLGRSASMNEVSQPPARIRRIYPAEVFAFAARSEAGRGAGSSRR